MVDRKYSLPTLDKSDHRNITYCVHVRAWGSGSEGGEKEREREGGREGERVREREERKERGGGKGVKYQSTSEVLAIYNRMYTLGISSFDVSCFTTQTLPLMYLDYTGKAHPSLDFSMLIHSPHTRF